MSLPWDKYLVKKYQPRYSSAIEYKYYPILGKYIYWVIMGFIEKGPDEEEYEPVNV